MAIDKPAGWLLAPRTWHHTSRNLQEALEAAIRANAPWVRNRRLRFLRYVHRLDAETSGVLVLAKSRPALAQFSSLFQTGKMQKLYLAIVRGCPPSTWNCALKLAVSRCAPRHAFVSETAGRQAKTTFHLIHTYVSADKDLYSVLAARPQTGRTHQIRVHLAATGWPIVGDRIYAKADSYKLSSQPAPSAGFLGLRAVGLYYTDPTTRKPNRIIADIHSFLRTFGTPEGTISVVKETVNNWPETAKPICD